MTLELGNNVFVIEAFDSDGNRTTRSLTLIGTDSGAPGFDSFRDVTTLGAVSYQGTTYNRNTGRLHADMHLTNTGNDRLGAPVAAFFSSVAPATVRLANGETVNGEGDTGVVFDDELDSNELAPGATSRPISLEFANPGRQRFDFDVQLLAETNTADRKSVV